MVALVYPRALPCPAAMTVVPRERRAQQGSSPYVGSARQLSVDDVRDVVATWQLPEAKVAAWVSWYDEQLTEGGSWFRATWPLPQGRVPANYRPVSSPTYNLVDGKGVWAVSLGFEVRVRAVAPQESPTYLLELDIDLDGVLNSGTTSAIGQTFDGFDPLAEYEISLPTGRIFTAWRPDRFTYPSLFWNVFTVTAGGSDTVYGVGNYEAIVGPGAYPNAEAARAGFPPGSTISGFSEYTFWFHDFPNADNDGGLSIHLERV